LRFGDFGSQNGSIEYGWRVVIDIIVHVPSVNAVVVLAGGKNGCDAYCGDYGDNEYGSGEVKKIVDNDEEEADKYGDCDVEKDNVHGLVPFADTVF